MLVNFTRELQRQKGNLDYHQVWRYTKKGKMPKLLLWLAEDPKLAAALARDAKELAQTSRRGEEEGTDVSRAGRDQGEADQ